MTKRNPLDERDEFGNEMRCEPRKPLEVRVAESNESLYRQRPELVGKVKWAIVGGSWRIISPADVR